MSKRTETHKLLGHTIHDLHTVINARELEGMFVRQIVQVGKPVLADGVRWDWLVVFGQNDE